MNQVDEFSARISLGGATCVGCVDIELNQSNQRQAGTFRACLAFDQRLTDGSFWKLLLRSGNPLDSEIVTDLDLGKSSAQLGAVEWTTMMSGQIDHVSMDPQTGLVEIEGRDLTARLIKLSVNQTFVNQTSSEIVTLLATTAGLIPNVAPTTTIVGQYYQVEHARASLNTFTRFTTSFDVIAFLAQLEGFDFWVSGTTLNFIPSVGAGFASLVIDIPNLISNTGSGTTIKRLRLDRRLALDNGAQVTVRSWNSRQRVTVEKTYSSSGIDGPPLVFLSPNLTDNAALEKAKALYDDLIGHRRVISCEMTGDLTLMPRDIVQVVGSQGWDGSYVIDTVTRNISAQRGFTQFVVARAL